MSLFDETLITLMEAAHQSPGRPHLSTVWRHATRGFRGIFLETVTIAGRRFTSVQALRRFAAATNRARGQALHKSLPQRVAAIATLRKAGIVAPQASEKEHCD
jgi:hypothetical protein